MGHFLFPFGGHCGGIEKRVKIGKKREKIEEVENVLTLHSEENCLHFLLKKVSCLVLNPQP